MKTNKILVLLAAVVFTVILPIVLLLTDVQLTAFDRGYYKKEYIKYNVPQNVGIEMDQLMSSTEKLLMYMENKRNDLDFKAEVKGQQVEFFSDRDKIHMIDVKNLFVKGRVFRNYSALLVLLLLAYLVYARKKGSKLLPNVGIAVSIAGIVPVVLLIILMNIDFYKYFTVFHKIFFSNDFWLLDPGVDRLVNIFPQEFFSDMAFRIIYLYIAELVVVLIASLIGRRSSKRV